MPIMCGFFCGPSKQIVALPEAFPSNNVPLQYVVTQCEKMFGVKSSKLQNTDDFALFHATGFNNIYSFTKHRDSSELNVASTHLDMLNKFLMAASIADKREIFLTDCKNYIKYFLSREHIGETTIAQFQPILDYCAQQFHLASAESLYEREHIVNLGRNVQKLVLMALEIKKLIVSGKPTEDSFKPLEKQLVKFRFSSPNLLASQSKLTEENALLDTQINLGLKQNSTLKSTWI